MMEEKKLIMGTMIRATMLGRGIRIGPPPPSPGNKSSSGHDICQKHYMTEFCEKILLPIHIQPYSYVFEGIVVADEAACATFGGATFVVGTCLGI